MDIQRQPAIDALSRSIGTWSNRAMHALAQVIALIGSLVFIAILVIVTIEVMSRRILNTALDWTHPLSVYLFVWGAGLSISYAYFENRHIRLETIIGRMSGWVRALSEVLAGLLTVTFALIGVLYGYRATVQRLIEGQLHADDPWGVPMWLTYAVVPVSLLCLAIIALYKLSPFIQYLARRCRRQSAILILDDESHQPSLAISSETSSTITTGVISGHTKRS